MTTLILKGKIVGDTYLFTSHEKSWYKESGWDEEDALDYRIELNDLKEVCQEILAENEKLYENFCEHGNDPEYWENKWIDQFEIEGFLEEFVDDKEDIVATAKRDYAMFWQVNLLVNDVQWEDEPPYRESIDLYGSTYGAMGPDKWFDKRYEKEIKKHDVSILKLKYYEDCVFKLEIDGEFVREKLKFNEETYRVEYDGKEFNLIEHGDPRREEYSYEIYVQHEGYACSVPQGDLM